ncbi:transposase [Streptomyces sp. NPDC058667]|uniref:transposase n=1 Tax=Streptomyces sp. NPDC058667 TaxID=3346588 RepID=UPI00364687C6
MLLAVAGAEDVGADALDDVEPRRPGGITELPDHGRGRSRGGYSTKLHLAVEQGQKPMSIVITAGQRGDSPQFETVLAKVRVPCLGPGRPRVRPSDRVRADKGVRLPQEPCLPAPPWDSLHHPGQG